MTEANQTVIKEIILLGLRELQNLRSFSFSIILITYCAAITGNLILVVLVSSSRHLHIPMYFFLTQISICDIILTTNIVPKMLSIIIYKYVVISLRACIIQFYFFGCLETFECFLLTVMSYDRYLAICVPLRYNAIMDFGFCIKLIVISWLLGFSLILITVVTVSQLIFCGPNVIDHFFCDLPPLLELSCSDTIVVQMEVLLLCVPVGLIPFAIVIISYTYIVFAIIKIPSVTGRRKAFSTCSSHLVVVTMYYWTLLGTYAVPSKGKSVFLNKTLSVLYTVVTPMLNPVIYSLRNKDIKQALKKMFIGK